MKKPKPKKIAINIFQELVTFDDWIRTQIKKSLPDELKDYPYYVENITKLKNGNIAMEVNVIIKNEPLPQLLEIKPKIIFEENNNG